MLFPTRCCACDAPGAVLCASCGAGLVAAGPTPRPPAGVDELVALLSYEGAARALVTHLKYRGHRQLAGVLGAPLGQLAADALRRQGAADAVVTWAPTSDRRRRRRGFDQARLLARATAAELDLPCVGLLRRRGGPAQTGADWAQRRVGPRLAPRRGVPRAVLVIDDVCTTGSTLAAAAASLRTAGAEVVVAAVVAQTPRPTAERGDSGSRRSAGVPKPTATAERN